jgi:hypothetical protein
MNSADPSEDDRWIGRGLIGSGLLVLLCLSVAWPLSRRWATPPKPTVISAATLPTYPATTVPAPHNDLPLLPFVDITASSGLEFVHDAGATAMRRLPETMGGGSLAFDFDLDGDQDLLLIHSAASPEGRSSLVLYANLGTGTFRDVTQATGLQAQLIGMGAVAADCDEDGWQDLLVYGVGTPRLWRNQGGWFERIPTERFPPMADEHWSLAADWLDYDRDGDLDLFIGGYLEWSPELDDQLDCRWNGVDPSYCDPDLFAGVQPRLYRNEGDGTWRDVSTETGVEVRHPDTGQAVPKITAVVSTDLNADGWPDLLAAGDGARSLVYLNDQSGRFEEVGIAWGLAYDRNGGAVRTLGLDAGWPTFDEGWLPRDMAPLIVMGRIGNVPNACWFRRANTEPWIDRAWSVGIGRSSRLVCSWGVRFVDFDLDGRLDLVTANGQLQPGLDVLQASQTREQPPQIFRGRSGQPWSYDLLTERETGAAAQQPLAGRGVNATDFDGDGDVDLLFTTNGGPPRLLRNDQSYGHHQLRIDPRGRHGARDPRGVSVALPDFRPTLQAVSQPVGGYLTQHGGTLRLGLGMITTVPRLRIHWPDGSTQEVLNPPLDRVLTIVQPRVAAQVTEQGPPSVEGRVPAS